MRKLVLMELDRVGLVALLLLTAVGLLMAFAAVTGFYYPWHDSSRPPVGSPEELVVVLLVATVVVPLISTAGNSTIRWPSQSMVIGSRRP